MKNKQVLTISLVVLILALLLMCINWFISPFSDVAVRAIGIIMIISLLVLVFTSVKSKIIVK